MAGKGRRRSQIDGIDPAALGLPAGEIDGRFAFVGAVVADPEFVFMPDEAGVAGISV